MDGAAPPIEVPVAPTNFEREAAELEYRCLLAERSRFDAASAAWGRYKGWGVATASLGALTTGSTLEVVGLIPSVGPAARTAVTGGFALALIVATAVLGFLDPKGERDRHDSVGKRLAALRAEVCLFRRTGTHADPVEAERAFAVLLRRHAEIVAEAMPLSDVVHAAAKKRLNSNVHYAGLRRLTARALR